MGLADSRICSFALMLAVGFAAALFPTRSDAYTADQQQACTGDAFRLCSSDIPDVDRVTACMIRKQAQLSPPCRAFFRSGAEPREAAERPPRRPAATHKKVRKKKSAAS